MSDDPDLHTAVENLFNDLTVKPSPAQCPKCGSKMMHVDTTFFSPGPSGKVWTVPLPVCLKCDLKEDTPSLIFPVA
jgi:hypothetical protein